jgi:tetratricopeptide (TPR) repeat protein
MNNLVRRAALAALLVSVSSLSASLIVTADAAQKAAPKAAKDAGPSARKEIAVPMSDASKQIDMKDFAGALASVKKADLVPMKTPYEEYMVSKYLGFIAVNQMTPDYAAATAAYNRQIASGGAPDAEKGGMYSVAMRLNYQAMDYPKVIQNAVELQKIEPLDETGYIVLVQSYFNTNDFANAAQSAKAALMAGTAGGKKPSEDMLGLLLNSQVKLKDEAGYRQTLDQLASVSTKPEVWDQEMDFVLAGLGGGKQGIEHPLLNLYRLSMLLGNMKDPDYPAMATIDLSNGLPAEAKAVLTKGNKTGELLDQANMFLARDQQALPALAAEAAKQMNGEIDIKLGESYLTYGRNDEAVAALQKGIEKGGLKDAADAQTTLGIALYNAGKKPEAMAAFQKADNGNSPAASVAHIWVLYVKRGMTA